jgi:hypothetical protein
VTLANALMHVRSAKNRVPHRTRWGTSGSLTNAVERLTLWGVIYESVLALAQITRRTAPTVLLIVWNIFR